MAYIKSQHLAFAEDTLERMDETLEALQDAKDEYDAYNDALAEEDARRAMEQERHVEQEGV